MLLDVYRYVFQLPPPPYLSLSLSKQKTHNIMCEFCLFPPGSDRDSQHSDFAGFFSAAAIDAAVQQAAELRRVNNGEENDDDDGNDSDDTDGT